MPSELSLAHWLTLHGLVTALAVLLYVVNSQLAHQRRQPTAAIAWVLFIVLLPYVALPAFLLFGSRKLARPLATGQAAAQRGDAADGWAVETLRSLGQPEPASCTALRLHADGAAAREALLAVIDGAQRSLDLCTFILRRDALGQAVVEHLRRQAAAGVRVRLMVDGMGSLMARRPDLRALLAAGAAFTVFVPPLRSPLRGRTNLRNHRKLLVADAGLPGARLWCGGRNLGAEYFDGRPGEPPWRDLSFDLTGPVVGQAAELFEHDWSFANGRPPPRPGPRRAAAQAGGAQAQLVASGPDQADDTVHALLVGAAWRARRRIALATPYFVPEPALLGALGLAARRGVAVDLLMPARSNHRLSDLARSRALRTLAQAGARVWLHPGMVHAKLVLIDDELALAGSLNLDSRSLFLNYELMMAFHDPADVGRFAAWFDTERATSSVYVPQRPGLLRDTAEGMLLWLGFQL